MKKSKVLKLIESYVEDFKDRYLISKNYQLLTDCPEFSIEDYLKNHDDLIKIPQESIIEKQQKDKIIELEAKVKELETKYKNSQAKCSSYEKIYLTNRDELAKAKMEANKVRADYTFMVNDLRNQLTELKALAINQQKTNTTIKKKPTKKR